MDLPGPAHAGVIVLKHRPGPELAPGDLAPERWPLRDPDPGEVVVRNLEAGAGGGQ